MAMGSGAGESVSDSATKVHHPIVPRVLELRRIEAISPAMARVTLGGADLAGFVSAAPTDHVKIFFPTHGGEPAMPAVIDGRLHAAGPTDPSRHYTVGHHRLEAEELDIDVVLHGEGVAVRWVHGARPGDRLGVLGPRWSEVVEDNFEWFLFAVDATGLPASERWLSELAAGVAVRVIAQVADTAEERALANTADLDVRWLHAGGPNLAEVLADTDLPEGRGFVWVAGEAGVVAPARSYLRHTLGLNADRFRVEAYWRRGVAGTEPVGPGH